MFSKLNRFESRSLSCVSAFLLPSVGVGVGVGGGGLMMLAGAPEPWGRPWGRLAPPLARPMFRWASVGVDLAVGRNGAACVP